MVRCQLPRERTDGQRTNWTRYLANGPVSGILLFLNENVIIKYSLLPFLSSFQPFPCTNYLFFLKYMALSSIAVT